MTILEFLSLIIFSLALLAIPYFVFRKSESSYWKMLALFVAEEFLAGILYKYFAFSDPNIKTAITPIIDATFVILWLHVLIAPGAFLLAPFVYRDFSKNNNHVIAAIFLMIALSFLLFIISAPMFPGFNL